MSLDVRIRKKMEHYTLDVTFRSEGGIFSLLGESGSGKTAALKCIAGILTPDEGRIVVDDEVLFDSMAKINVPANKRRTGFLVHDFALFPTMTVEENIRLAAETGLLSGAWKPGNAGNPTAVQDAGIMKRDAKVALSRKAAEYLRDFSLDGIGGYYPSELSPSQKLRAAAARMLAAGPRLVLLDDPFSTLEGFTKVAMLRELKQQLDQRGIPAVFASTDRDEVYAMSSGVCVMKDGVSQSAQRKKLFFDDPKTMTGALLSGCENVTQVHAVNATHALSADWGMMFCFPAAKGFERLPAGISAIGIRAADFQVKRGKEPCFRFPVKDVRIEDGLHEWTIYFRPGNRHGAELLFKAAKSSFTKEELTSLHELYVPCGKVLRLVR